MKNKLFAFLFVLSLAFTTAAQKAQPARVDSTEANLRRTIEYLASDKLEGRRAGEPGATLAANYIAEQFKKIKLRPGVPGTKGKPGYLQPFSFTPVRDPHGGTPVGELGAPAKRYDTSNVIGILQGHDPVLKNEAIVIGAHYDHLGHGGQGSLAANSTEIHHGADDNASGVAAIIEMARQFAREKSNKRTLIFIAFSGEEEGLFGSSFYVNNPIFPLDTTVAMINLDMVGRLNDGKLTIGGIGTASEWREAVSSALAPVPEDKKAVSGDDVARQKMLTAMLVSAGMTGVHVGVRDNEIYLGGHVSKGQLASAIQMASNTNPRKIINNMKISEGGYRGREFTLQLNEDGFGPSDHSSFYGKKIPVLFFFTGTHNDYHKPTDTADKINYEGEVNVIRYIESVENAIDQNPQRPTYAVAKSANTGGRTGFSISLGTIPNYADSTDGLLLDGVRDGSPAAKAGVKAGDKVVKLAGHDIRNVYDYTDTLVDMKADVEYEIVVLRGGERLTLKIVPVKR